MFETNSSSMHSLIVLKDMHERFPKTANWKEEQNADGTYTIVAGDNDFGRVPLYFLAHPVDKFLYLVADRYSRYSKDTTGRDNFIQNMIDKLDGCTAIEFSENKWDGCIDYGYIDHQSTGLIWNYLDNNGIDAIEFIFDPKSVIIIDGDEYCAWDCVKDSGLVDLDNIEFELNVHKEDPTWQSSL